MTLQSTSEFALITRLLARLTRDADPRIVITAGDDSAAWEPTPGALTVATADALVEDVHFTLGTTTWRDLGWKAMAENVSDIAAMGCHPRYALVTLGVPGDRAVAELEALYDGFNDCASAYDFAVVGGDVVRAPVVTLSVTLIGESEPATPGKDHPSLMERSAARPGDLIAVTGPLGGSAAGLQLLLAGGTLTDDEERLATVHRRPQPRVAAGLILVVAGVRCAMDISDGLVQDVGHICERSGADAEIVDGQVPLFDEAVARFGAAALELALTGGEDYELVCTGPAEVIERASLLLVERGEPPLTVVGLVLPQAGAEPAVRVRDGRGELRWMGQGGYQHFGSGE